MKERKKKEGHGSAPSRDLHLGLFIEEHGRVGLSTSTPVTCLYHLPTKEIPKMMKIHEAICTSPPVTVDVFRKRTCQLRLFSTVLWHSATFKLSTPEAIVKLSI